MTEFDHITPVTAAIRTARGHVDITAAEGTAVAVDVVALEDTDAAREAAAGTLITLDGDTLTVHTPDSSGFKLRRTPKLGITVRLPLDSTVAVRTASADVRAVGRYGAARVSTASGDAYVEDVTGDAQLEAASGDLTANRVGGSLRIHSASGDLRVGDVAGDVSADTASGDIAVRTAAASVKAETASGDITLGMVRHGSLVVRSASGDVAVGVAAGTGVWLDLNTASGTTRNELSAGPAGATPTGAQLDLRIRTASGDVDITRVTTDVPAPVA